MKIRCFICSLLFLGISNAFGQKFHFRSDKNFKYQSDSLLQTIGINHPDFSKVDLELRYWIRDMSRTYAHELFILDHYKNKRWYLRHYQICLTNDQYSVTSFHENNLIGFDDVWSKLILQKILTLQTENEVRKRWKSKDGTTLVVADGVLYGIEVATSKRERHYFYGNPKDNLKFYDSENDCLPEINNIIDSLNNLFAFNAANSYKCPR